MGTSRQQDRSLSGGISLPQWMKGRTDNRFDFDDAAFSPPSYDDSFFYIRHQKSQNSSVSKEESESLIPELSNENSSSTCSASQIGEIGRKEKSISSKETKINFSKHPLSDQPFIPRINYKAEDIRMKETIGKAYMDPKSQKESDNFGESDGESALYSKSIVHMANKVISCKLTKVFAVDSHSQEMENWMKNGSKSLPASPLTSPIATPDNSPKPRRKIHVNRYFTGTFVPDREKYQGNWILATMFGQSREIITPKIEEEDEAIADMEPNKPLNRKRSISSQNLTYIGKEENSADKSSMYANVLQPKPSELREMNFWSPTSM